jgi:hypothetical protein
VKVKRIDPTKIFRCNKKGKTRGRPSKLEITMGKLCDFVYLKHKKEIDKVIRDTMIYGTGILEIKK